MSTTTTSTITLKGRSGAAYQFWVYPWGHPLKAEGGVYAVLRNDGNSYSVLYIGQTADLSERFDYHHKAPCFERNGRSHIAARLEGSELQRRAIETDLIGNYLPPCNG